MKIVDLQPRFKRYFLYEKGNRPNSYRSIIATLKTFSKVTGIHDLEQCSTLVLREYLLDQQELRQWSPKTFRNYRQDFKSFFNWCVTERMLKKNPIDEIAKPKLPKALPRCLTKQEFQTILYTSEWYNWRYKLERIRNTTILATFGLTGLRLQELINLETLGVNLLSEELMVKQGKNRKDRLIPIHPQLITRLENYVEYRRKLNRPSRWFFTGVHSDKQLTPKDIRRICQKVSISSGIYFTPHMLRHTFGRLAVEADLNLYKIKAIMGHESTKTTERYISASGESIKRSFRQATIL